MSLGSIPNLMARVLVRYSGAQRSLLLGKMVRVSRFGVVASVYSVIFVVDQTVMYPITKDHSSFTSPGYHFLNFPPHFGQSLSRIHLTGTSSGGFLLGPAASLLAYRIWFHPLRHLPGPILGKKRANGCFFLHPAEDEIQI